jgi:hypothetical protein
MACKEVGPTTPSGPCIGIHVPCLEICDIALGFVMLPWIHVLILAISTDIGIHAIFLGIHVLHWDHLSRDFPHFSDGKWSTTREASLVTSRDQIARLVEPTAPYLGHLMVRSRSRSVNER